MKAHLFFKRKVTKKEENSFVRCTLPHTPLLLRMIVIHTNEAQMQSFSLLRKTKKLGLLYFAQHFATQATRLPRHCVRVSRTFSLKSNKILQLEDQSECNGVGLNYIILDVIRL